jgi:hypothetical protein
MRYCAATKPPRPLFSPPEASVGSQTVDGSGLSPSDPRFHGRNRARCERNCREQISHADSARISNGISCASSNAGQSALLERLVSGSQCDTTLTTLTVLQPALSRTAFPASLTVTTGTKNSKINCPAIISGGSSQPNTFDDSPVQYLELQWQTLRSWRSQ